LEYNISHHDNLTEFAKWLEDQQVNLDPRICEYMDEYLFDLLEDYEGEHEEIESVQKVDEV